LLKKAVCLVLLAFILAAAMISRLRVVPAEATTWTVDDDPSADFHTIQEAVNAVSQGDTILVYDGTYSENVVVNKSVSLLGVNKETTIVDGNGAGTVVEIDESDVVVANLTVRNGGKTWGPPLGSGTPDSCILADTVFHVQIIDNILMDAAVCVWTASSSSVNITDNTVLGAAYGGIIGYSCSYILMSRNHVNDCGLMGLHLDGYSYGCTIVQNTITNNVEGLELERGSTANQIEDNTFTNNNSSIVLNDCGSLNVFRRNTMSNNLYHLVIVGNSLDSFLQDIDSSNIVSNKLVYYLTNLRDQGISPLVCPNLGYLALVNCMNIEVKDFILYGNGDGVLVAYSTNCIFTNIIVGGNRGPLVWGGFTFYSSTNNIVSNSGFSGNSYALTFYRSEGNIFHHNYFVDNERQVVSDFLTPFSTKSSGYLSANAWDDGFEGNHWGDYTGADQNRDGIGDSPFIIDANNQDRYPLMTASPKLDVTPPELHVISPSPGEVLNSSTVTVVWEGWDDLSGINRYELRMDGGIWQIFVLTGASTHTFTGLSDGRHTLEVRAFDNAGNMREDSFEFFVNRGGFQLPSYMGEVVIAVGIIVAVGVALYVVKMKGLPTRKATSRRLVR